MARDKDRTETLIERRRHTRHELALDVDYSHGDTYLFSHASNISELGIFLITPDPPRLGTRVELRFTPPGGGKPLRIQGQVRWVVEARPGQESGMGVEFIDPSPECTRRVRELIRTVAYLE